MLKTSKLAEIVNESSLIIKPKPFIRWAGGKQSLISEIFEFAKDSRNINRYFEPFLGGASFFLYGDFKHATLSDLNPNLINAYNQIKNRPDDVFRIYNKFSTPVTADDYYNVRLQYNKSIGKDSLIQAARFIWLNKTSFNGIYRVNKKGKYNVPFGKSKPALPTLNHLKEISIKLQCCDLLNCHYSEISDRVKEGDLVYLDPPYPKLSDTAYFNQYTLDKFDDNGQIEVESFASKLSKKGAKVIISNADIPLIRDIYSDWNINETQVFRNVSCKKERIKVKELIITN